MGRQFLLVATNPNLFIFQLISEFHPTIRELLYNTISFYNTKRKYQHPHEMTSGKPKILYVHKKKKNR